MTRYFCIGLISVLTVAATPAIAHHSNVTFFFMDQTIEITGVVREFKVVNPHSRMLVEVTEDNGETAVWVVDSPNATGMRERGWTATSVTPGETVTIVGSPARNPKAHGIHGERVIKADGRVLEFRGAIIGENE